MNFKRLWTVVVAAVIAALYALPPMARAQGGTGELSGIVYDQTGAVVAGAKVVLTNSAQGITRETVTTESGVYRFVALPVVGTYNLKVEAKGFKVAEIGNIVVSVARTVTFDVHLEIGAAVETVLVEGGVQQIETTESQLSALVDRRLWQSLPLEIRDQNIFINILPGVVPNNFSGTTRGASVNGIRPGTGSFLVEGYDNNDQGQGGRGAVNAPGAITSISPEAIQEYRVLSNSFTAEYGKGGGFVTDTVLRSGTNEFHGSAFEYNRVQALATNSFFSNKVGQKDRLVRNQFGFSFGGPVIKDKTFLFGSAEWHRRRTTSPATTTGTTQDFLNFVNSGAFETFQETDPNGFCVINTAATCPGRFAQSNTLGPIFKSYLAIKSQSFPLASTAGQSACAIVAGVQQNPNCVGAGNLSAGLNYPVILYGQVTVPERASFNEYRISAKGDQKLSGKDQLSGTFLYEKFDQTDSINGSDTTIGPPSLNDGVSVVIGLTLTHTFTPNTLNQFRASYLRHRDDFPNPAGLAGLPSVVTAFDPLGIGLGSASNLPQFFTENQFQYQDHLSMIRGQHAFKLGGEFRRTRNGSSFQAIRNGLFEPYGIEEMVTDGFFGDNADQALGTFGTAGAQGAFFIAQASVNPVTAQLPEYYRGYRANEVAMYAQDDWRMTKRLTINVGLRWEYFGPPHNFRKGLDSNFYFGNAITPVPASTSATRPTPNLFFPVNSPLAGQVQTGGFQQRDHDIWNKDLNNFGPRIGFAWDLFGNQKMVLRSGYGIFYDRMWNNLFENIRFNAPFFSFASLGPLAGKPAIGPVASPGIYTSPFTGTSFFATQGGVPAPRHMDQNLVTAYAQQYFFGWEYEFARNYVFEANYVGTMGDKLLGVIDINTFDGRTRGGNSLRINQRIGGDNFRSNAFRSNYNGLQLSVRKNFSSGLQFNANYTYSHALDALSDAFTGSHNNILRPTDNFNIALDRGNADFDIRHRFVVSYYYDLPFFKSNRWAGGWSLSGIVTLQTGVPIPLWDSGHDPNADGYRTDRPVYLGPADISKIVTSKSPANGYFDATQFRAFASNGSDCATFGQGGVFISATRWWCDAKLGRNVLHGPSFVNTDFGVAKKFKLTERFALQFQANFFNLFNHPNFDVPVGNLNDSTNFGKSISTLSNGEPGSSGARVTQLALRLDF